MKVSFEKTGPRRYAIRVTREGQPVLQMDPAPGYDDRVPHDLFHFVVEQELSIAHGVFGQLAEGGDAGTFYPVPSAKASREQSRAARRIRARGKKLAEAGRSDADFSEKAVGVCEIEWAAREREARSGTVTADMAATRRDNYAKGERIGVGRDAIDRVCDRLVDVATSWSELEVGEALELSW